MAVLKMWLRMLFSDRIRIYDGGWKMKQQVINVVWRHIDKIGWKERIRNERALRWIGEDRRILREIRKKKVN